MSTVLVFAGHSFIGRALCAVLRERGLSVVATARQCPSGTDTELCDLTRGDQVADLIRRVRPAGVVQCAGATRDHDPQRLYGVHVLGTLHVLQALAKHAPHATVLLLGSAAEYGPVAVDHLPIGEEQPTAPTTFFGASKLAQTLLARTAAAEWPLNLITARPFNVIGPGLPDHYFVAALACRLRQWRGEGRDGPFPVANLDATRDFVDVRDVAAALAALLLTFQPVPGHMEIFNIASGAETPLREVAGLLGQLAGGYEPVAGGNGSSRGGIQRSCGSSAKLRQATAWQPRYAWQQSVTDFWSEGEPTAHPS